MKNTSSSINRLGFFLVVTALTVGCAGAQTVIFSDDFSGDESDLNGVAPDVRESTEVWVASPIFNADGSIERPDIVAQGSMTLPFIPQSGRVYYLDASFSGVTGNGNWLALGYANGQSTDDRSDRFITDDVVGTAWMLIRGDTSSNTNQAHLGTGVVGPGNGGTASPSPWTALGNQNGGEIDLRITLDTTGGPGTWTATWYAKLPASDDYSEVRETTLVGNEVNFTSIGVAVANSQSGSGTGGTVESFTLSSTGGPEDIPKIISIETNLDGNLVLTLDGPAEGFTVQRSDDLVDFADVAATAEENTLTIDVADIDSDGDGSDYFRIRS